MPGSYTDWAEAQILNHTWGGSIWTVLGNLYMSGNVTQSGETGAGAEPGSAPRTTIANNLTTFPAAVNGTKNNGVAIQTATATTNLGEFLCLTFWDSPVGGNAIAYTTLPMGKLVASGDSLIIPPGVLSITAEPGGLFTNFLKNAWLNHLWGAVPYNPPSTWHIGYFTTTPDDSLPGTEPVGNAYARAGVSNTPVFFPTVTAGGVKTNGQAIEWPEATGAQGTPTHFGFFDSVTAGNYSARCEITTPSLISALTIPWISAGTLAFSVD